MILYRDNKDKWELSEARLARRFLASKYAGETEESLSWRLSSYIVNDLHSTWSNEKAFTRVMERIHGTLARERTIPEVGAARGGDRTAVPRQ